jgi:ABC-type polysaccharide/polyol phosphate export permease
MRIGIPLGRLQLLTYLARSELQRRHAGSVGGVAWTVIAPMALIGAMWFALDIGLGMRAAVGPGFGTGLIVGMVGWLAFADSVSDSTSSVLRNPHLVKKMVFPVELMPLASVAAAFTVHLAILAILALTLALIGQLDLRYVWTLPLWMALSIAISSGIALAVSSLNIPLRDTQAATPFVTTIWFWLTPIVWSPAQLPEAWRSVFGLNPMAVVVEGYKTALTGSAFPFYAIAVGGSLLVTALLCAAGAALFTALRPSFADSI